MKVSFKGRLGGPSRYAEVTVKEVSPWADLQ